jgi:rSAM/selenodomain-associated transferase 1
MNRKQKSSYLLCIFSRYPQAGKCKTRLIPQLGPEGAADLQRRMTEHIIEIGQQADCDVLLCLDGGSPQEIRAWPGSEMECESQQGADLGERMLNSFIAGFARQYQKILLVGSDCPDIDPALLDKGFEALAAHDIVLGPAVDGGYYLLGMNTVHPELFTGIDWGTDQVLVQTLAAACNLDVLLLPVLQDVDSPEDLASFPWILENVCS